MLLVENMKPWNKAVLVYVSLHEKCITGGSCLVNMAKNKMFYGNFLIKNQAHFKTV